MSALGSYASILCDLDGVLVDSHAAIERGYDQWADRHGLDRTRVRAAFPGTPARQVVEEVAPWLDPAEEAEAIDAIHAAHGDEVRALPGAAALLGDPPAPLAVVTSCTRALAARRFEATGLTPPEVQVCADDVARGKPDPDAYLLGARRMGVSPGGCVVLEDAPAGVRAGRAAGMTVIAVHTTHDAGDLAEADRVVRDLTELLGD